MTHEFSNLPRPARTYVLGVSAIGIVIALHSLVQLLLQQVDVQWLILAGLTLLTGTFTVRIPGVGARLSVSDTFVFASVLLFGPAAGAVTALLDALIISLRLGHHAREPFRVIFNVASAALSTKLSGYVFFAVAAVPPYSIANTPLSQILLPLFLFTLSYFLLNSWLVAFALALEQQKAPLAIWRDNFLWLSVNYFGGGSVAGLLVTYSREIDFTTLGIIVPLLLISYLTFKTSLGRIEDANEHLTHVNKMYLSTIETLAMAIDAKDQITHGHIRRVQRYAIGLAKAVGVEDESQIKAIEAAALLHDMGKLAIPEFILNKPGRLTVSEFDVMKQHANIGADILSSIQFPYPVVPIVRHHHENWDGSGYPDRLKGTAIPLGARILSVVDCFDALTSDRPYRPRLSVAEATAVLAQRRGAMYDPFVVDKFIEAREQLSQHAVEMDADKDAMDSIATKLRTTPELPAPAIGEVTEGVPMQLLALLGSINPSPEGVSVANLGLVVSNHLARLTKARSIAFYCLGHNERSLRCFFADGPLTELTNGPHIALGERLSGWVAAHRTPIWNSDATLDLAPTVAEAAGIALGSSVPLIDCGSVVGAVTFYSPAGLEIPVDQRVLIQAIAPLLATALSAAIARDQIASVDAASTVAREAIYSILDALLSHGSNAPARPASGTLSVALLTLSPTRGSDDFPHFVRALLPSGPSRPTDAALSVVRLSMNKLLITVPSRVFRTLHLSAELGGLETRTCEFTVAEITNSLQLREALGLTLSTAPGQTLRTSIH